MAEVIGDDIQSFIETARKKKPLAKISQFPLRLPRSFVGSHITGYDNMIKGILSYLFDKNGGKAAVEKTQKINFIPGV